MPFVEVLETAVQKTEFLNERMFYILNLCGWWCKCACLQKRKDEVNDGLYEELEYILD
jgi:hypothetical protein